MTTARWRALLLGLCAIAALLPVLEIFLQYGGPLGTSYVGQWGDTVGASSRPFHLEVLSIDPGHGADRAGLRSGDLIDIRANSPLERFWLFGQPPTGRAVSMTVRRGNSVRRATIVPETITPRRLQLLTPIWFGYIWIALFAGIIAWRRSSDPQMRSLCLLLLAYAFWENTNQHYISSESLAVLILAATANALGALAVGFWAACATSFALPLSRSRRIAQRFCYAMVAAAVSLALLKVIGIATLATDPIAWSSSVAGIPFVIAAAAATWCSVTGVLAAQGAERQRAIWALGPAGALILGGFGAEAIQGVVHSYEIAWNAYYVAAAINVLTPLALTYVALNRRLLDIGFVLNRAAVFAVVSTIVIFTFVLVEWIANEWLSANHTTSAVVGMVLALSLGLSMRYVHRYVDRFVDRVFFHQRHRAEAALRSFAHEAGFITDRATLLQRTLATVRRSTGADASILTFDNGSSAVDVNDPALVAMRAWHRPVDLETFESSALHGQFAFPMVARGTLIGALVCGTKSDSEVYAPDESEALQLVADGVASALELLGNHNGAATGALHSAIGELREAIRDLRAMKQTP